MNKDLVVHLRLKGRTLSNIAEEVGQNISVVHSYLKKYARELIDKWVGAAAQSELGFYAAYSDFNEWCEQHGYAAITVQDFKSAICMIENKCGEVLCIAGGQDLILNIDKLKSVCV